jgi:hypothetical protein
VIGLKAINCSTGDTLAVEKKTAAGKEKVLDAVGEAAAQSDLHEWRNDRTTVLRSCSANL